MTTDPIRIEGLRELRRAVKAIDPQAAKELRLAFNEAADVVVSTARPRVPKRSGRAQASVKARSTQSAARVVGGGSKARHYPWLDFGGKVGPRRSVSRPFYSKGRYIYDAYYRARTSGEFDDLLVNGLKRVARSVGLDVEAT